MMVRRYFRTATVLYILYIAGIACDGVYVKNGKKYIKSYAH